MISKSRRIERRQESTVKRFLFRLLCLQKYGTCWFNMNFKSRFPGKNFGDCLSCGDSNENIAVRRTKGEERCPIPYPLRSSLFRASSHALETSCCAFVRFRRSFASQYCYSTWAGSSCWRLREDSWGGAVFALRTIWDAEPPRSSRRT